MAQRPLTNMFVCMVGMQCMYLTRQEAVGVSLAMGGNILISVSLNMQKHAHNMNDANPVSGITCSIVTGEKKTSFSS
jgi:hypothetical protein